jgi:hypothetical protein
MDYSELKMNIKAQKNEAYIAAFNHISKQIISGEMTIEDGAKYLVDNGYDLECELCQ